MRKIRKYRGELGMTQEELAKKLGVSRMTVVSLENDPDYTMTPENAEKLARIFHCGIYDIVDIKTALMYTPLDAADSRSLVEQVLKEYAHE